MKKSILILSVAGLALFSCKKEQKENVSNTNNFVKQQKDNEYRVPMGKATVTLTDKVDSSYSKYQGLTYNYENKNFSFINDNVGEDNEMSTKTVYYKENGSDVEKFYTIKTFNINMYEVDGFDKDDIKNSNKISFSFSIYEGTLKDAKTAEGYSVDVPQDISLSSSYVFQPEKTIDVISNSKSITTTAAKTRFDSDLGKIVVDVKKIENVIISSFMFDEVTGKISFDFTAKSPKGNLDVKGKVETTILRNNIEASQGKSNSNAVEIPVVMF